MSTLLEHHTLAAMVAENDRLYRASAEASDAVSAIEYTARDAIAASEPVTVPIPCLNRETGKVDIFSAILLDGTPIRKGDASIAAFVAAVLETSLKEGRELTEAERETVARYQSAVKESKERADAIRAKVYADRGYEAALAARDKAYEVADAHTEQLNGTPIRTMADAVAAIQFIRDTNADWEGLGDRALAFLREKAA